VLRRLNIPKFGEKEGGDGKQKWKGRGGKVAQETMDESGGGAE